MYPIIGDQIFADKLLFQKYLPTVRETKLELR